MHFHLLKPRHGWRADGEVGALDDGSTTGKLTGGGPRIAAINPKQALIVVLLVAFAVAAATRVVYLGGGADDVKYIRAAQCVADHLWCVPDDHWARRFPLVLPLALVIRLSGTTLATLWIVPALYSVAVVALFVTIVSRQFDGTRGMLAGLAFVLTPAIGMRFVSVGIDLPEFAFLLGATYFLQRWVSRCDSPSAGAMGLCLGFAVACRPTMLAAVLILGIGFLALGGRRHTVQAAAFFLLPLLIELLVYAAVGDPLRPWRLSLAHATIPSDFLTGVDLHESPILNVHFIQNWEPAAGVKAHWAVQGLLNYLISMEVWFTHLFAVTMAVFAIRNPADRAEIRIIGLLLLLGLLHFALLTYVFSIDPRPRMFMPLIAVECVAIGVFATRTFSGAERLVAPALFALQVAVLIPAAFGDHGHSLPAAEVAR
ncbi:MAG: ArnT family glycosyltransferase [Sphingomicrobium sp.]|nr:glycosyltransferase family 39 protein [Sphingomonadales bacterium]